MFELAPAPLAMVPHLEAHETASYIRTRTSPANSPVGPEARGYDFDFLQAGHDLFHEGPHEERSVGDDVDPAIAIAQGCRHHRAECGYLGAAQAAAECVVQTVAICDGEEAIDLSAARKCDRVDLAHRHVPNQLRDFVVAAGRGIDVGGHPLRRCAGRFQKLEQFEVRLLAA